MYIIDQNMSVIFTQHFIEIATYTTDWIQVIICIYHVPWDDSHMVSDIQSEDDCVFDKIA